MCLSSQCLLSTGLLGVRSCLTSLRGLLVLGCLLVFWMTYCYLPLWLVPCGGFSGKVHKRHYRVGTLCHLESRHVSKAVESGGVWNVNTWHQDSPLTFNNTPFLPKGVSQAVVSQLRPVTTFHHQRLLLVQRKQILDKECVLFFPFPPHQIISTELPAIGIFPHVSVSPVQCEF